MIGTNQRSVRCANPTRHQVARRMRPEMNDHKIANNAGCAKARTGQDRGGFMGKKESLRDRRSVWPRYRRQAAAAVAKRGTFFSRLPAVCRSLLKTFWTLETRCDARGAAFCEIKKW